MKHKRLELRKAFEVDVFDENMQITKAPISMGTVGTSAFEETIMRRYEQKMHSLIDERISTVLRDNPNDSEYLIHRLLLP